MSHSNYMLIEDIKRTKKGNKIVLSASVQFRGQAAETMYFATDEANSHYITADASPFLAAVLLPCMKTGENIFIRDVVSRKLLQNTKKIMDLVSSWNIGLQKINIFVGYVKTEKVKSFG